MAGTPEQGRGCGFARCANRKFGGPPGKAIPGAFRPWQAKQTPGIFLLRRKINGIRARVQQRSFPLTQPMTKEFLFSLRKLFWKDHSAKSVFFGKFGASTTTGFQLAGIL